MKKYLRLLFATVFGFVVGGSLLYVYETSTTAAMRYLLQTNGVGSPTLNPSKPAVQTWAYSRIMQSPDASRVFKRVFSDAGPAGQIYALGALSILEPDFYSEHEGDLPEKIDEPLEVIFNCMGQDGTNPNQILKSWMAQGFHVTCNVNPVLNRFATVPFGDHPSLLDHVVPARLRAILFDRWLKHLEDRYNTYVGAVEESRDIEWEPPSDQPSCLEAVFETEQRSIAIALGNVLSHRSTMIYVGTPFVPSSPELLPSGVWQLRAMSAIEPTSEQEMRQWVHELSSLSFEFHLRFPTLSVATVGCPNLNREDLFIIE